MPMVMKKSKNAESKTGKSPAGDGGAFWLFGLCKESG